MKDFKNKYRSQSNRLPEFDYTRGFWYYVTICTKDKIQYFGTVKNRKMLLNHFGKIAHNLWKELPKNLSVNLNEFIIMPNHMHGIIILEDRILRRDLIHQVSFNKSDNSPRALINQSSTKDWILMKQKGTSLGKVIRSYKAKVSYHIRNDLNKKFAWQSNYYEHIIRNTEDYYRIRNYIIENPAKWEDDEYYASHPV